MSPSESFPESKQARNESSPAGLARLLHFLLGELTKYYVYKDFVEEAKGWIVHAEAQVMQSVLASQNIDADRMKLPDDFGDPAMVCSPDDMKAYRPTEPGTAQTVCECSLAVLEQCELLYSSWCYAIFCENHSIDFCLPCYETWKRVSSLHSNS